MKRMMSGMVLACLMVLGARAAEKVRWPVWVAFNDTENIDVVGLRLNFPAGQCDQVCGMDIGLIGRSQYFSGIQLNLLRNSVTDALAGWQIGGYNSAGFSDMVGLQTGLWNESKTLYGFQVGLVNLADYAKGFQVGLVNRVEGMYGYQIGLINIIRDGQVPFCPFINIGF